MYMTPASLSPMDADQAILGTLTYQRGGLTHFEIRQPQLVPLKEADITLRSDFKNDHATGDITNSQGVPLEGFVKDPITLHSLRINDKTEAG